ncbi:abortive infection bacteriophage resistance protein [Nocardioides ginsengisegetis]|uniref:Abortive infection bacteriophage resistance protein n=1 Tax=Nocardioides ginsengisegetis TaxID=661491 RepID=A0A7W3PBD7_9ACTN|nr:Abi family protein [Nocardioides ginsengisegetis]MBA8805451.1 abortive infection bacteriophage resistance protein [Nocardioides ginsengisegetis]
MRDHRPRARGTKIYSKPPLSHQALNKRMAERGLQVPDAAKAERYLRHIGYYRLSPYIIPFHSERGDHQVRPTASFDDVLDLYVFDRALRLLVMDALERVEVGIRSALTDHMSLNKGGPHWFLDAAHFRRRDRHSGLLEIVRKSCSDQLDRDAESNLEGLVHRSALEHYLTTYGTPELPPSWLMVESLTLGQLRSLISNLADRSDRTAIARSLGLNEPLLMSWLRSYVRIRNICAHHGRLWNAGLGVYPALPSSPAISWLHRPEVIADSPMRAKRLYPVLVSLQAVLDTLSPNSSWAVRLSELLTDHPNVPLHAMGIPADWRSDDFWSRHLF